MNKTLFTMFLLFLCYVSCIYTMNKQDTSYAPFTEGRNSFDGIYQTRPSHEILSFFRVMERRAHENGITEPLFINGIIGQNIREQNRGFITRILMFAVRPTLQAAASGLEWLVEKAL